MKVTIVTLEDTGLVEHYVGAIKGSITKEDVKVIAKRFNAVYNSDIQEEDDDEDVRYIFFRELDIADTIEDLKTLQNIDGGQ